MSDRSRRPLPTFRDMRAWDVRNVDGTLVTTIGALGQVLGMSPAEAVRWVRSREDQRAMPDELIAEARQAR
ncbi:hypothetical protein SIM91_05165 [Rhodococcus opacus]|uniref:hypothetical protein n=1 Tax=Rhodococcus opacus TaxID=37919 RepID=UPI0002E80861|nr:hypothetical protein [Rhodococcus opacus]MDX5962713.1 hypothetical protein [Rhodococcus opacus]CAG7636740.1 hypothetical protein E143388_07824 [Rhodococcus opacus]